MKNTKRRLPIPQFEFGYSADCFCLIQEVALDGERLARERAEAEQSRQRAEAAQAKLFAKRKPKRLLRRAA